MTLPWVRLWNDMPADPKWRVIAKRSGRPLTEVIALFNVMMVSGGLNPAERGVLHNWSDEDVAATLDIEVDHVSSIRSAMQGKVLEENRLMAWKKRQPIRDDGSAERSKSRRNRMRPQPTATDRPTALSRAEE